MVILWQPQRNRRSPVIYGHNGNTAGLLNGQCSPKAVLPVFYAACIAPHFPPGGSGGKADRGRIVFVGPESIKTHFFG